MKEDDMSLRDYELVMKSVADPTRVRILKLLEKGEMCVCQIIAILEFSQSTISKHLFLLKMAHLVKERKEGKWVHYSLNSSGGGSPYARKMLQSLRGWLNDDPVVGKDRKREAMARKMGPVEICGRGMTLPARWAGACCPPPGNAEAVSK
jgi:DNA-binding transcriptional ArsR family regulator